MKGITKAAEVLKNAYAPYSKFGVGCAITTATGKTFTGCNVENSSFGASLCAERNAIGAAVAAGERELVEIYLVTTGDKPCVPCGICLQVISEFGKDVDIMSASYDLKTVNRFKLSDLLPHQYDKSYLPKV